MALRVSSGLFTLGISTAVLLCGCAAGSEEGEVGAVEGASHEASDAFDPRSCEGASLTRAEAAALAEPLHVESLVRLADYTVFVHRRVCQTAGPCGEWETREGAPQLHTIASKSEHTPEFRAPVPSSGAFELSPWQADTDPRLGEPRGFRFITEPFLLSAELERQGPLKVVWDCGFNGRCAAGIETGVAIFGNVRPFVLPNDQAATWGEAKITDHCARLTARLRTVNEFNTDDYEVVLLAKWTPRSGRR